VEEELEIPLPVAEPPARRQPPAPPPPPAADEDLLGMLDDAPEPPPAPARPSPTRAPSPPPAAARASPHVAPAAPSGLAPDLARALANVDQSLAFGFVDEAKEALRNIGARYPSHPAIIEKIEQFGLDADTADQVLEESPVDLSSLASPAAAPLDAFGELGLPESGPAAPAAAFPESAPFDLGNEIGDLFSAQAAVHDNEAGTAGAELGDPGLVQIFEEFRKGVDQQLGNEDYDTRYNLGIAYKEMGLIDEAVAEFQLAAKDPQRLLECSSMLGLCFLEKGMPKLAVKWFEKGLKAPGRLPEEYNGLRYDLAAAHDAAGEPDTALSVYAELYGQDASFRDVAAKVRELKARRGR
jgi:tetratricopeptide (TPR) repeat protein